MANMCTFTVRVFGTREQRDEVARQLNSRIESSNDRLFINGDGWWVEVWAKDVESVCVQTDDALLVQGESKDVPGLHLAKELSEKFPDLTIHIGGSDEDDHWELWELIGGEGRLLDRGGPLDLRELGFGIGYWLVRDGQVVSSEQRQAWIAENLAKIEASNKEEFGTEFTAEQQMVIRRKIEQLEERIRRGAEPFAASVESSIGGEELSDFKKEGF